MNTAVQSDRAVLYPELPEYMRRRGVLGAIRIFGPGAIIASVTIGSGETLFASRTGAIFGYTFLWFILLAAACKTIQVYTAARYMTLTGEHPMEAWVRLPGPRGWFPAFFGALSIFCFPFWLGGLSVMLGTAMNWIFGLDQRPPEAQLLTARLFGTATLVIAAILTLKQSYGIFERVQTLIVGILLVAIIAAVIPAPVQWLEAAARTFGVHWPSYESWVSEKYPKVAAQPVLLTVVIFMGAIGGGPYDYIGYLSFFREKGWGAIGRPVGERPVIDPSRENLSIGRQWLRAPIIDVFTGFGCVLLFTMAFNILGAAILHPVHEIPDQFALLTPQVRFLEQFGSLFRHLYQLGIFMAFWGTIYGALEVYSRTVYECLRPLARSVHDVPFHRFRLFACLFTAAGGLTLMWVFADPLDIVKPAALIGTTTCGIWCFAMIWTDRRDLPPGLRMNGIWILLNLAAGVVLTGFGGKSFYDWILSFWSAQGT